MSMRRWIGLGVGLALSLAAAPRDAAAVSRAAVGDVVRIDALRTLEGRSAQLSSGEADVSVLVFFKPGQAYSLETLQGLATCTEDLASKPVQYAGVVSSAWPAAEVREAVAEAGVRMPVLVDRGDDLYGKLGIQVYPAVVVLDREQRLVAHEPFLRVNYCDRIRGKILYALHEIDTAEMRLTEDPSWGKPPAGEAAADALVSARTFVVGHDRFEEPAPVEPAVEQQGEVAPEHVPLGDVLAAKAAREEEEALH
jgi:hypothetical protein